MDKSEHETVLRQLARLEAEIETWFQEPLHACGKRKTIHPTQPKVKRPKGEPKMKMVEFHFDMPTIDKTFRRPWSNSQDLFVLEGGLIYYNHCSINKDAKEIFFPASLECHDTAANRMWIERIKEMMDEKRPAQGLLQTSSTDRNVFVTVLLFKSKKD